MANTRNKNVSQLLAAFMIHKFNFIEKMLLNKDVLPHPLIDAGTNIVLGKSLGTAVNLGITDNLSSTPQTAENIAKKCNISEKGAKLMLDCLEALDYVENSENGYQFSKRGDKFLRKDSPDSFRNFILFLNWSYDTFTNLEETVKNGEIKQTNMDLFTDREWELFSRAMIELANTNKEEVAKKIKIQDNAKQVIDLGGSHGLHSMELCKKKPDLNAIILDLEPVRKYTEECINENNMSDRVKFQKCDILEEEIPSESDIALLFNIIHACEYDVNQNLFKKIYNALNKGGQLVVLDQIRGIGGKSQLARATTSFMAVNLFQQVNGNTYSYEEVKDWAEKAGFENVKLDKLRSPGFGLITCRK